MTATVVDLRRKMRDVMRAIDRRENVTILYRGKPRALLVPLDGAGDNRTPIEKLSQFGMWSNRKDMKDPSAWVRKIRKPRYRVF